MDYRLYRWSDPRRFDDGHILVPQPVQWLVFREGWIPDATLPRMSEHGSPFPTEPLPIGQVDKDKMAADKKSAAAVLLTNFHIWKEGAV